MLCLIAPMCIRGWERKSEEPPLHISQAGTVRKQTGSGKLSYLRNPLSISWENEG